MSEQPWDQMYAERATYVLVCFTTPEGERVCIGVPGWEPPPPGPLPVPVPVPVDGPVPPPPPPWPLITIGDTPRPVPWMRDLSLISAAVAAVSRISSPDVAGTLREHLLAAAQEISKDVGATVHLHG